MPVDAGDPEETFSVTLDHGSNSVSEGDAVTFDGSGDVATCTANDDDLIGVAHQVHSDGKVTVVACGPVVNVNAEGSVSAGDTLVPSGTTDGAFASHGQGMYNANPDTDAGAVAANHPYALEDASDGDTFRAAFR